MKTSLCIPKFKSNSSNPKSNTTQWLSPISLLERFREAVFRLIMITALSKTTTRCSENEKNKKTTPRPRPYYYSPDQQYQSDAVADCIEFIKKSASPEEYRDSFGSISTDEDDDQTSEDVSSSFPVV